MDEQALNHEVVDFIVQFVDSVEQMEVLCLLSGEPEKAWSAGEIFKRVQSSEKSTLGCLLGFVKKGLVEEKEGVFRFSPKSDALSKAVLDTTRAYHEKPVRVVEAIYKKPSSAIEDFADAFRLRKDK